MKQLYIHFYNGINKLSDMKAKNSWGFDGPTMGPLHNVATTGGSELQIVFKNSKDADKFESLSSDRYDESRGDHQLTFLINKHVMAHVGNELYLDWNVFLK